MKARTMMLAAVVWAISSATFLAQMGGFGGALPGAGTVTAIDRTKLTMSLRTDHGEEDTFVVSPAVKGFNALQTGDKIKMTYYESLVYSVVKPGGKVDPASIEAAMTRAKNVRPSGSVVTQEKMTVTVKSVNTAAPSITVTTQDAKTITRKVQDKSTIMELRAGDRVEIAYTRAMLATAERQDPAKK